MSRGEIDPAAFAALMAQVREVAAPWFESRYYADAEPWTDWFWREDTRFRHLFNQLDSTRLLELAVGHGRHAERAAPLAGELVVMDVVPANIERCRQRLDVFENIVYVINDGFSFRPLENESVSGIYCYDAMVHFSPELVEAYLCDAARVLRPGGRAVLHHSNLDAPRDRHYGQNLHARNHMTLPLFASFLERAGLEMLETHAHDWGEALQLDRLSLVQKPLR